MVVLLADDDSALRKLATLVLQEEQYCVLQAVNGDDALHLIRNHQEIDLILTDVEMGDGLDGFELRERILQERPGVPILLMSGLAENETIAAGSQIPFLAKPFSIAVLIKRVGDLLYSKQNLAAAH
jgi:DNA-binding response OmpR family regulator